MDANKNPSTGPGIKVNQPADALMHDFKKNDMNKSLFSAQFFIIIFLAILLGVGSGYVFAKGSGKGGALSLGGGGGSSSVSKGQTFGSDDTATFKDTAEGILKNGGINGEGQYHLVRPGGDDQNVYLTSSIVDLSQFIDHKIKVWGATQKAQTAGWLMDVGKVQVEE